MFLRPEELLLPARLLWQTLHFLAVLMVFADLDYVVSNADMIQPNTTTDPRALATFHRDRHTMTGLSWGSVACLAIEYVLLFLGVAMFRRRAALLNILLHFTGFCLTVVFYYNVWPLTVYTYLFAIFCAVPVVIELLFFVVVARLRSLKI